MRFRNKYAYIGIDEVGRGALAGPVFVAAVAVPRGIRYQASGIRNPLKDSKQLTPKIREAWFRYIKKAKIPYAVRQVSPRVIDRVNISVAANLAALRAYERLLRTCRVSPDTCRVRLDGGLFLGKRGTYPHARTIVKGDERMSAIALASIVAKVSRDRYMVRLAKQYSPYGFEEHKGYGTRAHCMALRKHGPSRVHRLTFVKKYNSAML